MDGVFETRNWGGNRGAVELEEVELGAGGGILEDTPALVVFGFVVAFDKVRDGCARVLDLLEAVTEVVDSITEGTHPY